MSKAEKKEESLEEMKLLLEDLRYKLNLANKALVKSENECKNLKKYNSDLIKQIDFTNSKLNVLLKVCDSSNSEKETQNKLYFTEDKKICPFCKNQLPVNQPLQVCDFKTDKKLSDQVKEWANAALKTCDSQNYKDFIYDSRSKTYYNPSTCWYYYPERNLYFDSKSKKFYEYKEETKSFKVYPVTQESSNLSIELSTTIDEKQKIKSVSIKNSLDCQESEFNDNEEGEIRSPDLSEFDNSNFIQIENNIKTIKNENSNNDFNQINSDNDLGSDYSNEDEFESACLRLIVRKSTTLEEGSLLLITCKGALIGKDADCDVQILDKLISRKHAQVIYDKQLKNFCIKDLHSKNGIYINRKKITSNQEFFKLNHNDILTLGDCELLLHYHKGRDVTCLNCEPGCVRAALKIEVKPLYETISSEKERRIMLKQLKKKYGINCYENFKFSNPNYSDRADKRRKLKGSDNPYEKTAEGTALDKPLDDCNKGFKLLKKLGWSQGEGLGKEAKGNTELLPIEALEDRIGLGYGKF